MRRAALAPLLLLLTLAACAPKAARLSNTDALEADIDKQMGGIGTCVVLADTKTGAVVYRYNSEEVCGRPLPPCGTFNIPTALIGLDAGLITPATVYKWDGTPQPAAAWQTNANLAKAYKDQIGWWFQRLASQIGQAGYAQALSAYGYGNKNLGGPPTAFWQGPQANGALAISTTQQAAFLARLYGGKLKVDPAAASALKAIMVDETRTGTGAAAGQYVVSGEIGSCPSIADGSRNVGWWVGRLKTPKRDLVFAASIEGATAPPGEEVESTMKGIFADQGFWPPES